MEHTVEVDLGRLLLEVVAVVPEASCQIQGLTLEYGSS